MAALARKYRICLLPYNSSNLCKYHVSLSLYFSTSTSNIGAPALNVPAASEFLIEKYQFSPKTASKVSALLKNPPKSDLVLSFLKESGFSNTQLEKVVKYNHQLLSSSLEKTIKPKIKIFKDLGFSAGEIAEIVVNHPSILNRSAIKKIIPSLSVLKHLLGANAQVAKVLKKPGWLLFVDLENTMMPNVEFLKCCGVHTEQINTLLFTFPQFFLLKHENMRRFVDKVDEMGVERSSKSFIYAVRAVSSMAKETWELKLKTFQDFGFSEDDILRAFKMAPMLFTVSEKKMNKVKEVLLETGKYGVSCILSNPWSLVFSVEKRYKLRLQVLKVLEKRSLITKWPCLSTLCTMSNERFFKKFVAPNINEVGEGFIAETAVSCKRETVARPGRSD